SFLAVPFIKNKKLLSRYFLLLILFISVFTISLYPLVSPQNPLKQWLNQGRNHYLLLIQYHHLGGLDGMILRVKQKLADNPNDAEGWFILGKLYLMKQDDKQAKAAFSK